MSKTENAILFSSKRKRGETARAILTIIKEFPDISISEIPDMLVDFGIRIKIGSVRCAIRKILDSPESVAAKTGFGVEFIKNAIFSIRGAGKEAKESGWYVPSGAYEASATKYFDKEAKLLHACSDYNFCQIPAEWRKKPKENKKNPFYRICLSNKWES